MQAGLRKIDELTAADHAYINENSGCFYFLEYPSGTVETNKGNPIYSFVHNFKKSPDRKGSSQWHYKVNAINDTIELFDSFFVRTGKIGGSTLVPIPPSKTKANPMYDDRMSQVLSALAMRHPNKADFKELIYCIHDMQSTHSLNVRPSIAEIQANYAIDQNLIFAARKSIILFDDVLTTGAHYVAAKNKILEVRPDIQVRGIFIARRILPDPDPFDDFDLSNLF